MKYSFSKIKQSIQVESMEEFKAILANIPSEFFKKQFQKSMKNALIYFHKSISTMRTISKKSSKTHLH